MTLFQTEWYVTVWACECFSSFPVIAYFQTIRTRPKNPYLWIYELIKSSKSLQIVAIIWHSDSEYLEFGLYINYVWRKFCKSTNLHSHQILKPKLRSHDQILKPKLRSDCCRSKPGRNTAEGGQCWGCWLLAQERVYHTPRFRLTASRRVRCYPSSEYLVTFVKTFTLAWWSVFRYSVKYYSSPPAPLDFQVIIKFYKLKYLNKYTLYRNQIKQNIHFAKYIY